MVSGSYFLTRDYIVDILERTVSLYLFFEILKTQDTRIKKFTRMKDFFKQYKASRKHRIIVPAFLAL
jgi:glutaredoxin-related protein